MSQSTKRKMTAVRKRFELNPGVRAEFLAGETGIPHAVLLTNTSRGIRSVVVATNTPTFKAANSGDSAEYRVLSIYRPPVPAPVREDPWATIPAGTDFAG